MKKANHVLRVFDYRNIKMTSEQVQWVMRVENLKAAYQLGLFDELHLKYIETFK